MAVNKLGLLLLLLIATPFLLSLTALADRHVRSASSSDDEDQLESSSIFQTNGYGGKSFHRKTAYSPGYYKRSHDTGDDAEEEDDERNYHGQGYLQHKYKQLDDVHEAKMTVYKQRNSAYPNEDDDDDDDEIDVLLQPIMYKKPDKSDPFKKPQYKYKPINSSPKLFYTKLFSEPNEPEIKPYSYKPKPEIKPYNHKPKPNIYNDQPDTKPESNNIYTDKPDTKPDNNYKLKPTDTKPDTKPYTEPDTRSDIDTEQPDSKPGKKYKPKPTTYSTEPDTKPYKYKPKPYIYIEPDTESYVKPKPIYTNPVIKPYVKPKSYIYTDPDTKPESEKQNYTRPDTDQPVGEKALPATQEVEELPSSKGPDTSEGAKRYRKKPSTESKLKLYSYKKAEPKLQSETDLQPEPQPEPQIRPEKLPKPKLSAAAKREWLVAHNAARAEVGIRPLVWSDEVAKFADKWANERKASGCGLRHSDGPYGENIFWGSGPGYGPAECVAAWASQKSNFNHADNSCSGGDCGHYTQIVWADSARLGCARAQCSDGTVFMTCNYDPPGNYIGIKPY